MRPELVPQVRQWLENYKNPRYRYYSYYPRYYDYPRYGYAYRRVYVRPFYHRRWRW